LGAAARALTAALVGGALVCPARPAAADDCWLSHRHGPFPVCFDPGNRLHLDATTDGLGGAILLRHVVLVDDPDVSWRLEHRIASVRVMGSEIRGAAYAGRYVRHSSDGHLVLPFGRPRKIFLPFDIGGEAEVGRVSGSITGALHVGAVRTAALIELSRASHFRRRIAVGAVARWDLVLDTDSRSAREHAVAPFSLAAIDLRAESESGLTLGGVRAEAGGVWSASSGWRRRLAAEAELERVLLAVQDRPVSIFVSGEYEPHEKELSGLVGVRLAPLVRVPRAQGR
jgi:hypothetical protein